MQLGTRHEIQDGRYCWYLKGEDGAVHVWFRILPFAYGEDPRFRGGIDIHRKEPVNPEIDHPTPDCWLLGGSCYHDGSTIWFEENLKPRLQYHSPFDPVLISSIQNTLHSWYNLHVRKQNDNENYS